MTLTPVNAMTSFLHWMKRFSVREVKWIASPASFDWYFLKFYLSKYTPQYPLTRQILGFYCLCLDSLLRCYLQMCGIVDRKKFMDSLVDSRAKYTHISVDDAVFQGYVYMQLRTLISQHRRRHDRLKYKKHDKNENITYKS